MKVGVQGIDLFWQEHGKGEPLLWLHGATGCGSDWTHIFSEPPEGYRLIAPDLRGHGQSTNPGGAFTFRQCARDALALLEHLGIPRVKAIGLSGGGIVLLHMAIAAPDVIDSMVLISSPPRFPEQARAMQRQFSPATVGQAELTRLRATHAQGPDHVDRIFRLINGLADDRDDVDFSAESLARITAETLIVFGDHDPLYPVSLACELRAAIARSCLWVVPRGGHGPVFGPAAGPFRATALAFLAGRL
jgi:pimeloyl-ACP methyl ester carboxylesterase